MSCKTLGWLFFRCFSFVFNILSLLFGFLFLAVSPSPPPAKTPPTHLPNPPLPLGRTLMFVFNPLFGVDGPLFLSFICRERGEGRAVIQGQSQEGEDGRGWGGLETGPRSAAYTHILQLSLALSHARAVPSTSPGMECRDTRNPPGGESFMFGTFPGKAPPPHAGRCPADPCLPPSALDSTQAFGGPRANTQQHSS